MSFCDLENVLKNNRKPTLPYCAERRFYSVARISETNEEKKVIVEINTVINKVENVR